MKLIISNLKMNMTLSEIIEYEKELSQIHSNNEIVVCPSFLFLPYFRNNNYVLGSQNVAEIEEGALTGEVSAKQLKSLNVKYSIVGHSERNKILLETEEQIIKKINNLLKNNITPIICIGEIEPNLDNKEIIQTKLTKIISNIDSIGNIVIAYEPAWAIGTGNIPDVENIRNTIKTIKEIVMNKYNHDIKVIYGGSVNTTNIETLNNINELDGYLLGESSLDINKYKEIIEKTEGN